MMNLRINQRLTIAALHGALLLGVFTFLLPSIPKIWAQEDHSADQVADQDEHQHRMDPAVMQELRDNIPSMSTLTDEQIMAVMRFMPGNYETYVSDANLRGDVGILILAHGTSSEEDQTLLGILPEVSKNRPTAIGFGMAMMSSDHLQIAADKLEAAGAKTIVLVPIVTTTYNSMLRQWAFAFGVLERPAYTTVPRIESNAKIIMARPFENDPLISEIMIDYAAEISTDPDNEWVIMVAHGPEDDPDNVWDTANLERHAQYLRQNTDYAEVLAINLQDDAPPPVRAANVQKLRAWIQVAKSRGKKSLVLSFVSSRGLEGRITNDLKELDYTFNPKGFQLHKNFAKWVDATVDRALEENQ